MKLRLTFDTAQKPMVENMLVVNNICVFPKPTEISESKSAINVNDVTMKAAVAVSKSVWCANNDIGHNQASIGLFIGP